MDLNAIRMFISAVQTGSFSKAAEKLQIPLSTVSRNINELEKSLKIQLFERAKTGVTPTVTGQRFYEKIYHNIDAILDAERNLHNDEQQLSGLLRIATPPSFFPAWQVIQTFQKQYPNVQVQCAVSERMTDFFVDGIDIAFRSHKLIDGRVHAHKWLDVKKVLVATPEFITEYGEPKTLAELSKFPIAGYGDNGILQVERMFDNAEIELSAKFVTNDYQAILDYSLQGLAIGSLPPYCAQKQLENGNLIEILPNAPKYTHQIYLVYPTHKHPSALLKAFVAFCLKHSSTEN